MNVQTVDSQGVLGILKGTQAFLAFAHCHYFAAFGTFDRLFAKFGGGPVYLYAFLMSVLAKLLQIRYVEIKFFGGVLILLSLWPLFDFFNGGGDCLALLAGAGYALSGWGALQVSAWTRKVLSVSIAIFVLWQMNLLWYAKGNWFNSDVLYSFLAYVLFPLYFFNLHKIKTQFQLKKKYG